jgi:hypothetical protein
MQCDKCGSENTQRLEVAFESGTNDINTKSHTAGVASITGALGIGGSVTKTSGISQSVLAQKVSPPLKKSYKWPSISVIVGLLCFSSTSIFPIGILLVAVGGLLITKAAKFNNNVWPAQYQYWQESWVCHKCGNIYHHA